MLVVLVGIVLGVQISFRGKKGGGDVRGVLLVAETGEHLGDSVPVEDPLAAARRAVVRAVLALLRMTAAGIRGDAGLAAAEASVTTFLRPESS